MPRTGRGPVPIQEILAADRSARNGLKALKEAGCDPHEIMKLLDNFRYAFFLEHLRGRLTHGRKVRSTAWKELFGLSPDEARTFRGRLDQMAKQIRLANKAMPLLLPTIIDEGKRVAVEHAIRWLPGMLEIYGAAFHRLIRNLRRELGRKTFNLAHDQERLLVRYITSKTNTPHYRDADAVLFAVQETIPGNGSSRGGEESLEKRCRGTRPEPVSIETLFTRYPVLGEIFLIV